MSNIVNSILAGETEINAVTIVSIIVFTIIFDSMMSLIGTVVKAVKS